MLNLNRTMKHGLLIARFVLVMLLTGFITVSAFAASEDEVKAAFILNFAKFVEWPETRSSDELVLGYFGTKPLTGNLELLNGLQVNERNITVMTFAESEAAQYDLVFIPAAEFVKKPELIFQFHERRILTISDAPDFIGAGGMIGLIIVDKKVRFEINQAAALAEGIKVSSQLLSLARRVIKK